MSALEIKNLNCFYQDNHILKDLYLYIQNNEIVCLLGESGCGKTTLLRAVAGLQSKISGDIKINDRAVNTATLNLPPELRKVGLIFQDYALFPHLSVFENVAFSLVELSKQEKKNRVEEVLTLVQLSEFAERFPHQLSGGQQQRIAIARALAYQPELMLLDEPFSNLDQHVRFQLIKEIRSLLKNHGMSALFVTHSKEEGFAFADKIALMQQGDIVQMGTPQQLYHHPKSRYIADFMGKSNYAEIIVNSANSFSSDFGLLIGGCVSGYEKGTRLQLLLRPEQLDIYASEKGDATIIDIEFLGAFQMITVSYKGKNYFVKLDNQEVDCQVNDKATLNVVDHDFVCFTQLSG